MRTLITNLPPVSSSLSMVFGSAMVVFLSHYCMYTFINPKTSDAPLNAYDLVVKETVNQPQTANSLT